MRKKKSTRKPTKPLKPAVKFLPPWETGKAGPTAGQFEEDPGEAYDFRHVHPRTQAVRRLFVAEYVKDFNGTAALLRLGFKYTQPAVIANNWIREPYTQYILDKYVEDSEEKALITRNKILGGLVREANAYGIDCSGASRVAAYKQLCKMLGLERNKTEHEVKMQGGVMFIPLAATVEEWETHATASQEELKTAAKS